MLPAYIYFDLFLSCVFHICKSKIGFIGMLLYNDSGGGKMLKKAGDLLIGKHLAKLIDTKYESRRQFVKEYLKLESDDVDDHNITNMSNRLSQILNGNKSIQTYDLPIFSTLLDISIEEILSGGTYRAAFADRITNYRIAASKDKSEWERYLQMEEQIILNADEYGKTVLDYALEFENYDFMKFLMEQGHIQFVGPRKSSDFSGNFGARTTIENNQKLYHNLNTLNGDIKSKVNLRGRLIALAVKQNDADMLKELRAREIPVLYDGMNGGNGTIGKDDYYMPELQNALLDADDDIIHYFSQEYEITDNRNGVNRYIYPFIGNLIDQMLEKRKEDAAKKLLEGALEHNRYVYEGLKERMDYVSYIYKQKELAYKYACAKNEQFEQKEDISLSEDEKELIRKTTKEGLYYYKNEDFVRYLVMVPNHNPLLHKNIISDYVQVRSSSNNAAIQRLITEVNELYEKINTIEPSI